MQFSAPFNEGNTVTAARVIASSLAGYGIERIFSVAGESFLSLLDALLDVEIDVVTCRHEGSAGFMALADAKLTGRTSACIVNRGPGASNACIALHAAKQDATPFLLLVGGIRIADMGRQAFQDMDYVKTFSDLAKGVWVLHDPTKAAEMVARAIRIAEAGTPGASVLVLPEDILEANFVSLLSPVQRWSEILTEPSSSNMKDIEDLLAASKRPLLIAGGRIASLEERRLLQKVAVRHTIPIVASNKHQDLFDNHHPYYAGHLNIATQAQQRHLLMQTDLILAVGTRLDHVTTQHYTLPQAPIPAQKLVHVYPDANQLGFVYQPSLGLTCGSITFLKSLYTLTASSQNLEHRRIWIEHLHTLEAEQAILSHQAPHNSDLFGAVISTCNELAASDVILTVDAGNFTSWVHRYFRFSASRRLLGISSSSMGFGVPSGVAAALRYPDQQVITFVGDGGFLMTGNELATAVQRHAKIIIIIANNNSYGTIRQHQERAYPGRVAATDLYNPDFATLAQAYGALGLTISKEIEITPVLKQAMSQCGPVVIDVKTDLTWISAYSYLPDLASS